MADVQAPAGRQIDRAAALAPYLAELFALLGRKGGPEGRVKIAIKQHAIDVQPWERAQLREDPGGRFREPGSWTFLICEGLAVQAKSFTDLARLAEPDATPEAVDAVRQDLCGDWALAIEIRRDFERVAKELSGAGRSGQAKYLGEFAGRVREALAPLEEALGPDGLLAAEELTVAPVTAMPGRTAQAPSPAAQARGGKPARKKGLSARHGWIAGVATALAVILGYVAYTSATAEKLTVARCLQYVKGIDSFSGEPPALRVVVSEERWKLLGPSEKTGMIHDITVGLPYVGYSHAELFLPDGTKVGTWDAEKGSTHD